MPTPDFKAARPTLLDLIERAAAAHPEAVALRRASAGDPGIPYARLLEETGDLAMALVDLGVRLEERVGLIGENSPRWAMAYLAVHKAGGIVVPMDAQLQEREIAGIGGAAQLRFVFSGARAAAAVRAALPRARVLGLFEGGEGAASRSEERRVGKECRL